MTVKRKKRHLYGAEWATTGRHVRALRAWLEAEEQALDRGEPAPSPADAMEGWPVKLDPNTPDTVGIQVRFYSDGLPGEGTSPRLFDTGIAVFLRFATMFDEKGRGNTGAYVHLDDTGRENGSKQAYPKLAISLPKALSDAAKAGWNIPVNRITADAKDKRHIKPIGDHHDCRRRNLKAEFPQPPFKPAEQTQANALEALAALYRAFYSDVPETSRIISEPDFLAAIRKAFELAYRREALRLNTLV